MLLAPEWGVSDYEGGTGESRNTRVVPIHVLQHAKAGQA